MLSQQIVNGLMLGGVYVLVAVAFTLAIGVLNFLNFSLPAAFMLGGMVTWGALRIGLNPLLAFGGAFTAAALLGFLVYYLIYRPSRNSDHEVPLVSSLGFLVLIENLIVIWVGSDQQSFPQVFGDFNLRFGDLVIGGAQVLSLLLSLTFVICLWLFLKLTNAGRRIRAVAENRETAEILGVHVGSLVPQLFVFSALFAALGGMLFAISYLQVSPFMGETVGFKGVSAMIIGGMGSVWGAIIGGLLIGLTEVFSTQWVGSDFVNIAVYGLLLLLVVVRPEGLLGKTVAREKL